MNNLGLIELSAIVGALLTFIGFGTFIVKTVRSILSPVKNIMDATRTTLRYSIVHAHREYMASGRIGRYALQCMHEMCAQYKALGGNGFAEELLNDIKKLPIEDRNDE